MEKKVFVPFVPAEKSLPEFTFRAVLLGIVLSVVMGAANAYLGLYAGMTVAASIPAAVVSMAILRGVFRNGNILENNIVQTIASAGESLAAGIIFTVPALVLVGAWKNFEFWPTTLIAISGGLFGVGFMVPLRRALIIEEEELVFPEGVACAEVLIAGESGGASIKPILTGLSIGAVFKFCISGITYIKGSVEWAARAGNSIFFVGSDLSPALFAVGYIINLEIAALVFLGGVIGWVIGIPFLGSGGLDAAMDPLDAAWTLWSQQIRYIGVGAMLVGGIWSIIGVRHGISKSIKRLMAARYPVQEDKPVIERTDKDIPFMQLFFILLIAAVGMFFMYYHFIGTLGITLFSLSIMMICAFFFVAVSSYIVGLVGTSNNPVSGMTICTLLGTAGLFLLLGFEGIQASLVTLGVASVVCCAAATAGDVSQDLKSGSLVGASPFKMQWAQIIGVVAAAFVLAPVLTLLHKAYGIGTGLKAPQATLFASIVNAMFGSGKMPWGMVQIGMLVGVALIVANEWLKKTGSRFRTHVMPVAIGIYLPFTLSVPIFLGGLLRTIIEKQFGKKLSETDSMHDYGVLFSSGLIAGESLIGIVIAILIGGNFGFPLSRENGNLSSSLLFAAVIVVFYLLKRNYVRKH